MSKKLVPGSSSAGSDPESSKAVDVGATSATEQVVVREAERLEYERIVAGKLSSEVIPGATEPKSSRGGKRKPGEGY